MAFPPPNWIAFIADVVSPGTVRIDTGMLRYQISVRPEEAISAMAPAAPLALGLLAAALLTGAIHQYQRARRRTRRWRESMEQLRSILDNAGEAIVSADEAGNVISFNRSAEKTFGYTAAEILGQPLATLLADGCPELSQAAGHTTELTGRRRDGSRLPLEMSLAEWRHGGRRFYTAVLRDITIRKRAEEARTYYRAIIESTDDAIVGETPDGIVVSWNRGAERIHGYTAAEMIGRPAAVLVPSEREREIEALRERLGKGESIQGHETQRLRKDGTRVDVCLTISPIRDWRGEVIGFSSIGRDITAQKRAEHTFRTVLELAPDAMVLVNAEGKIALVNAQAERMFGYRREELLGHPVEILAPEPLRARHAEHRARYVQAPASRPMGAGLELTAVRKDGSEIPAEISLSPIETPEGLFVTAAIRDVTERHKTAEIRAHLSAIVESSDDAILSTTPDGVILSWNPGCEKLYGYSAEEVIGKPMALLIPPGEPGEGTVILERIRRGERVEHLETEWPRKDGTRVSVSLTISPIRNTAGEVVAVSTIARDITRRKLAELELQKAQDDLELRVQQRTLELASAAGLLETEVAERRRIEAEIRELNAGLEKRVEGRTAELRSAIQELEAFSYSVSHDLRAPLRAVNGFAEAVLEDYGSLLDERGRKYLQLVSVNARAMGRLIDDLLAFSRTGRRNADPSRLDMTALAREVFADLTQGSSRDVRLELHELPPAEGDPSMIRQVWVNLLANALKFTRNRNPAVIEIGAGRDGDHNLYYIRDNGAGFDMRFAGKLFRVFERLHSADEYEGTGVGLAIVQRVIQRHGGKVWAEGKVDEGATLYFTLPAKKESDESASGSQHPAGGG